MLVTLFLATATATPPPSPASVERLVLVRGIDALFSGELTESESSLTSLLGGNLRGEASYWLSEVHLRNQNFEGAFRALAEVGESVAPWRVAVVEVEAMLGLASGAMDSRAALESAWEAANGDPRGFGVGACLAQIFVETGEYASAAEVLRTIGGAPERIIPDWLRGACGDASHLLAIPAVSDATGGGTVTILGERWAWDISSGVLFSFSEGTDTPCPLPAQYSVPPDAVDLSLTCVGDELWFVRHMNGESSLCRVDGSGESSFEIGGMAPATVSARLGVAGTELLLGGVIDGEPIVAIWDRSRGLRAIPTGDWVLTSPAWRD